MPVYTSWREHLLMLHQLCGLLVFKMIRGKLKWENKKHMGKPCTEYVNALSLDLMELFLFISVLFFLNIIIYNNAKFSK